MMCGSVMTMNDPHKISKIYDRLNDQPNLQKLIRDSYYDTLISEQRKNNIANHKLAIGELNRAFENCRQHMKEDIGECDENRIIDFMIINAPAAYCKCDFKYIINLYYGKYWHDYYSSEYLDPDYNDLLSD